LVSTSVRHLLFGSRTNVFLSGKAETTAKTRQVLFANEQIPRRSLLMYKLWPGSSTPATFFRSQNQNAELRISVGLVLAAAVE